MLLKTNQKSLHGGKICLPIVGEVDVNDEGQIDVSEEVADLLLTGNDWEAEDSKEVVGNSKSKETSKEVKKVAEKAEKAPKTAKVTPDADTELSAETKAIHAKIDEMSLEDLIQMAEEAKIKGYHLFKKSVQSMRTFMKKKVQ